MFEDTKDPEILDLPTSLNNDLITSHSSDLHMFEAKESYRGSIQGQKSRRFSLSQLRQRSSTLEKVSRSEVVVETALLNSLFTTRA